MFLARRAESSDNGAMPGRSVALLLPMLLLAGCGSGLPPALPDPGPDAGLDGSSSTLLVSLTPSDLAGLCDWTAGRVGGYGRRRVCGGLTLTAPANQMTCVTGFGSVQPSCTATVADFEGCVNAAIDGPCTAGAIPAACFFLLSCGMPML
jgi:hypothetical protein